MQRSTRRRRPRRPRSGTLVRILIATGLFGLGGYLGATELADADVGESVALEVGVGLALACAVATQLSALLKHKGVNDAPTVDIRHPFRTAGQLWSRKWFAIGMALAAGAWLLHVAAMALAPLSVVQAVLSTGVVILAVMAARFFGAEVGRRQYLAAGMSALGLVLLVATLPPVGESHSDFAPAAMAWFEGGLFGLAALLIAARRFGLPARHGGIALGAAAGIAYAISDVALKALTGAGGVVGIVGSPMLAVAIAASVIGFYASARGMQREEAVPVLVATSTAANVLNILGGILVFGDPMPTEPLLLGVQVVAFLLVVVAAILIPPRVDERPR